MNEQNSARWEENSFLGRPEPIYTYQNTSRSGTISFKVVVDHPSILNLLVREHFKGMSDEEADNYINAFFAGCEEIDFYSLIQTYTTLDSDDINLIKLYLNSSKPPQEITKYKYTTTPVTFPKPDKGQNGGKDVAVQFDKRFYFANDYPKKDGTTKGATNLTYTQLYTEYIAQKVKYTGDTVIDLGELIVGTTENHKFPAQIWRMNDDEVTRTFATKKVITKIVVDPKLETADIDVTNNTWPKEEVKSKFD
jgi:hypothetical protein